MIRFCPVLVGYKEQESILIGNGKYRVPVLNPCLKEKCIAYKDGKCKHFDDYVEVQDEKSN